MKRVVAESAKKCQEVHPFQKKNIEKAVLANNFFSDFRYYHNRVLSVQHCEIRRSPSITEITML